MTISTPPSGSRTTGPGGAGAAKRRSDHGAPVVSVTGQYFARRSYGAAQWGPCFPCRPPTRDRSVGEDEDNVASPRRWRRLGSLDSASPVLPGEVGCHLDLSAQGRAPVAQHPRQERPHRVAELGTEPAPHLAGDEVDGDRLIAALVPLGDNGSPVPGHLLRDWHEKALRRAGLPGKGGLHVLRHTFCSHLAKAGSPGEGHPGVGGASEPDDDAPLHAPVAGGPPRRHPPARRSGCARFFWRHRGAGP